MKLFVSLTKKNLFIIIMLCSTIHVYAQVDNILWQKEFEAVGGFSYSPGSAFFDVSENKLLIMGTSFHPKAYSEGKLRLWEIDQDGNMTKNIDLGDVHKNSKTYIQTASQVVKGLSISKNREIKVLNNCKHGKVIMSMDRQGSNRKEKSITETTPVEDNDLILKNISLPNGSNLLIGKDDHDNGLVIKTDSNGIKQWEQTYDNGKLEYFSDGVAVGNKGGFILVGGSVTPESKMSIGKDSSIWIVKCDSQGEILADTRFSGDPFIRKMPQICQISAGELIVAYAKLYPDDLTFKAFSSDLKVLWENKAFENEIVTFDFKIKAVPAKGFIVAFGIGSTGLGVYEYDKNGDLKNKTSFDKIVRGGNFLLEVSEDRAFVILQARAIKEDRINRLKVLALQLSQ